PIDRSKDSGKSHRRSQRSRQISVAQYERFPRNEICSDATERDRQVVEIPNIRIRGSLTAQKQNEGLPTIDTSWKRKTLSELKRILPSDAIPVLFFDYRAIFKLRCRTQEIIPVRISHDLFQVNGIVSCSV